MEVDSPGDMVERLRYAVVGSGAVGGYFGGCLARAGHEVTFVVRDATQRALEKDGLHIESPKGDFAVHPIKTSTDPSAVGVVDVVIVTVKAWQVEDVAPTLVPLVGPKTLVVPLQNGVEARGELARSLGESAVCGGLCWILAERLTPNRIHHRGGEPLVSIGEWDGTVSARIEALAGSFEAAGIKTKVHDDIQAAIWEKFVFITALSGVGAVTRMPVGVIRTELETRDLLKEVMAEIMAVGRASGVQISEDVLERTLSFIDKLPEEGTASMQRDLMAKRPSELEAQNGAVVRIGRKLDIFTPVNRVLYYALLPMEREARKRASL